MVLRKKGGKADSSLGQLGMCKAVDSFPKLLTVTSTPEVSRGDRSQATPSFPLRKRQASGPGSRTILRQQPARGAFEAGREGEKLTSRPPEVVATADISQFSMLWFHPVAGIFFQCIYCSKSPRFLVIFLRLTLTCQSEEFLPLSDFLSVCMCTQVFICAQVYVYACV